MLGIIKTSYHPYSPTIPAQDLDLEYLSAAEKTPCCAFTYSLDIVLHF